MKKNEVKKIKNEIGVFQISQRAVIFDPETKKFLLVRIPEGSSEFSGFWGFVGGRVEKDEDLRKSLEREIVEEVGDVECEVIDVVDFDTLKERARVSYAVKYLGGEIVLSDEHDDFAWKTAEEIAMGEYDKKVQYLIRKTAVYFEQQNSLDNWKRVLAEFENYKKSKMNLERDMAGRAVEDFAYRLLPVVDNFHASTDHIPEDQKDGAWVQGIMYIQKQLEQVLGEMGVVEIEAKEGDVFDPSLHEAVQGTENGERKMEKKEGRDTDIEKVKKVLIRGYKRGERVIRPTRVTVE